MSRAHRRRRQPAEECLPPENAGQARFVAVQLSDQERSGGETFPLSVGFSGTALSGKAGISGAGNVSGCSGIKVHADRGLRKIEKGLLLLVPPRG